MKHVRLTRLATGALAAALAVSLVGCGAGNQTPSASSAPAAASTTATTARKTQIQLYYADAQCDFLQTRTVELNELTPETLLQVLQANGMLDKDVKVQNWLATDRDDPYRDTVLTLDLSKAFQDQLSANAATEHTILASLVNTFLDAYRATEITLTADGKPLEAKTVQTSEPFTYMNLALTPTFQTEATIDGKQETLTLTWASAMGCAIGYDANSLKLDPTSSIAPLAFRGIDQTDVTFTVMLSSTPAAQLVEESKQQSEYAESTVTLERSGYQATRLTLPDTPREKDVDYTGSREAHLVHLLLPPRQPAEGTPAQAGRHGQQLLPDHAGQLNLPSLLPLPFGILHGGGFSLGFDRMRQTGYNKPIILWYSGGDV